MKIQTINCNNFNINYCGLKQKTVKNFESNPVKPIIDKEPQKKCGFLAYICDKFKKFTNSDEQINPKDNREEIRKLQQEISEFNLKENSKAPMVRTATTIKKEEPNKIPLPNFSFNYEELRNDLLKLTIVDTMWVENYPEKVENIINAATKGKKISKDAQDNLLATPESKASLVNTLLENKDKFLEEAKTQYDFEKAAYVDSVAQYTKNFKNLEQLNQAIDAIREYGTAEDLEKINYIAWVFADEPTKVNIIKTMGAIGNKETNYARITNIFINEKNTYSNETYIEAFKTIAKLTDGYGGYEDLLEFVNKIPNDKDGEFTKTLVDTLIAVGLKEDIDYLDKYLRNYGHVNWFKNKGEETPRIILDTIETIRKELEKKG